MSNGIGKLNRVNRKLKAAMRRFTEKDDETALPQVLRLIEEREAIKKEVTEQLCGYSQTN